MPEDDANATRGRPSKVKQAIDTYGLDGLGAELEAAWTAGEDRMSLRELADLVNRRIVESALTSTEQTGLPGEVATVYAALAGEADGATTRDVHTRLEQRGIDPDTLEADLVSYQAVRTYLNGVRGVEYERESVDAIGATRDRIDGLRGRLRAVTNGELEDLAAQDEIAVGNTRVMVQVQVYCQDCGRQYSVDELLDQGGCDCS